MKTIKLPFRVKCAILACGADLKGAFALAKDDAAYLFDGFGDLAQLDNFARYEKSIGQAQKKLNIEPRVIVCDLHPGYFSTQFCTRYLNKKNSMPCTSGLCTRYLNKKNSMPCTWYKVQHHEAHVASAIIDNDIKGDVLGVAFDGTGYGTDGNIWGGEFFTGNAKNFKRIAHLEYIPMPGGEMCIRQPWRMAASYVWASGGDMKRFDPKKWAILKKMTEKNINSPLTSSMGRLFDAVGSLVLGKDEARFEAELPIELEKIADKDEPGHYDFDLKRKDGEIIVNTARTIKGILKDLSGKAGKPQISAKFHNTIAEIILKVAKVSKMKRAVLSGGVFQNRYLKDGAMKLLSENDLKAYAHSNVETNDSGIPIGQIAIANARFLCV